MANRVAKTTATAAKQRGPGKGGVAKGYLHGFDPAEQDRLYRQARFLESSVYEHVDFSKQRSVIEVGCGVGAQTEILLDRFPHLHVHGVDAQQAQIDRARRHLRPQLKAGRVSLDVGDALKLPFADNSFDGGFICWLLEHVQNPVAILAELKRVLKTGGVIYLSEVLNATFYVHPYSPATQQYWFAFNDHQWNLGGDPFVGAKLANYLLAAGYQDISLNVAVHHYDNRSPKRRAQFIEYWTSLLLSGAPGLLAAKRVTAEVVREMTAELERLKNDPDAVFFYSWVRGRAEAR